MSAIGQGVNRIQLQPGELTVYLHYGKHLKNGDWIGEQDPYVIFRIGDVTYKSNIQHNGGRDPVWNQQFVFKVDQETRMALDVYDYDSFKKDDCLGKAEVDIVSVRHAPGRTLSMEVPVFGHISRRQHGHVYITLSFRDATGASIAANSNSSDTSTYALHERQAEVAKAHAAAVAAGNTAVLNDAGGGIISNSGLTAGAHTPAAGSSLPSGLLGPGQMPDSFQSYEPQGGLITPHPDRLLPCHQGIISGSDTAQAMAQANDPPGSRGPEGQDVPRPTSSSSQYPAIHVQPFNISDVFRAPDGDGHRVPAAALMTASSTPHPEAAAVPYSVPYDQQPILAQTYSHPVYGSAYPTGAVGYYPHPAPAPPYYPPPPQVSYSMSLPDYTAPQQPGPEFSASASYAAHSSTPLPPPPYGAEPMPPNWYHH